MRTDTKTGKWRSQPNLQILRLSRQSQSVAWGAIRSSRTVSWNELTAGLLARTMATDGWSGARWPPPFVDRTNNWRRPLIHRQPNAATRFSSVGVISMDDPGDAPHLPAPFVVGERYLDRNGEYVVVAVSGSQVTVEHADGRRSVGDVVIKARIHRGVLEDSQLEALRVQPGKHRRGGSTVKRERLILEILRLEADGLDHTGLEIDLHLRKRAHELGYSDAELEEKHVRSGRRVFASDGDWAKAVMTEDKLHEVVGDHVYVDSVSQRRLCKIYRITRSGIGELRRRGDSV